MSLFVIGDLHLSLSVEKPMDIFRGWNDYVERLKINWQKKIKPEDTVVLAGDLSWGINLTESKADFDFVEKLNGTKIILKGNHDYWWETKSKMERFFAQNGYKSLKILFNNHYRYENIGICGTRGWINENGAEADKKILLREAGRLETSIKSALSDGLKPVVFLHYPPIFKNDCNYYIMDVIQRYGIKNCYYGHVHGKAHEQAVNGIEDGVSYHLISSDFLKFDPLEIKDIL